MRRSYLLCCAGLFLLCGCNQNSRATESVPDDSAHEALGDSSVPDETAPTSKHQSESSENSTENSNRSDKSKSAKNDDGPIAVTYTGGDGRASQLHYDDVSEIDLSRPTFLNGGEVFTGWEEEDTVSQIADETVTTDETIMLSPEYVDIHEVQNAIYYNAEYVSASEEYVTIPLVIGGDVNFSVLEIDISYSSDILEFDSFEAMDADAVGNCTEPGKILLSFVSSSNISADVELCSIKFKRVSKQPADTALRICVQDIAAWNEDATDYISVNSEVMNEKITLL